MGIAAAIAGSAAIAGPPYATDDPEPTEPGRWEIYAFATGAHVPGETGGALGIELNYGAAPDLQLSATVPVDYAIAGAARIGAGDIELAAKYRFLHQRAGGALPDVAFFPRVFLPSAGGRFGTGHASLLLPLWAQKDFGDWSAFGGGGYVINPGHGQRDFWTTGFALQRQIDKRLAIGAEAYRQTASAVGERSYAGVNAALLYRLSPRWSWVASGGPGIAHARAGGRYNFYVGLRLDR